jgi:hypothetical protein
MLKTTMLVKNWISPKGSTKTRPTVVGKSDNNNALLGTDVAELANKDNLASLDWLVGKRRE